VILVTTAAGVVRRCTAAAVAAAAADTAEPLAALEVKAGPRYPTGLDRRPEPLAMGRLRAVRAETGRASCMPEAVVAVAEAVGRVPLSEVAAAMAVSVLAAAAAVAE